MARTTRVATLVASLLALFLLAGSVSAQEASPGLAAADWIAGELASDEPSFDEFGVAPARADVIFALAGLGARPDAIRQAAEDLRATAADYVGEDADIDVGALAKVLLAVQVIGEDPDGFLEGRNLEGELRAAQRDDGTFADDTFRHALAMIALGATDGGVPEDAVGALMSRQNDDGSLPDDFDPEQPSIDNTALAVQALLAAGAAEGLSEAVAFLVDTQNDDGSWPNPFGAPNANTVGLAGQALRAAAETEAADRAAEFVLSLQTEDGGFAFDETQSEPNGYATLQAVLALGGPAYHQLTASSDDAAAEDSETASAAAACAPGEGTTVVVDFSAFGGSVEVGCAPTATTGVEALEEAGFEVATVEGSPFVCRIDGLPGPDTEDCAGFPPGGAFWSYWTAELGGDWAFSSTGPADPIEGHLEGWAFSTGENEPPAFEVPPAPTREAADTPTTATDSVPSTTEADTTTTLPASDDEGGAGAGPFVAGAALVVVLGVAGLVMARRRRETGEP